MSSQQHVHNLDHHHHTHFDHVLAGLHHLRVTHRERINRLEHERKDLEIQRAALVREFQKHADIHDVWFQNLEGYEDKTYPIESQMETSRHYFWGMVAGMVIAIVLGVYFTVSTMLADSFLLLLLISTVVAIVIGVFASVTLRALLGASAVRPHAAKGLSITVVAIGITFVGLAGAFAWLRFQSDSPLAAWLPALMVGMELAAIIFAGASDCGYRMYRWSGVFHERHRQLMHREAEVEDQLANKHVDLLSIEHRIKEHDEVHHDGHHGHVHVEEHHENHHETVHH